MAGSKELYLAVDHDRLSSVDEALGEGARVSDKSGYCDGGHIGCLRIYLLLPHETPVFDT